MDMTSLDSLSPEELAALEKAIAARKESSSDPIGVLAGVVEMLVEKFQSVDERIGRIEEDFYKKVLAGIDDMYKENMRADGMKGFGEKYSGMFGPLADDFKRTFDADLMEKAYDYLESLKGEEGYSDEVGDGKLKELVEQIKGRLGPKPAAVSVEVEKTEPAKAEPEKPSEEPKDEEPDEMKSLDDEIARMKKKDAARKSA